jgi:MFS family permease
LFVFTKGIVSIVGLVIGGLILFSTIPVNVVMGQELAPSQAGTISAMMMGAAWGMAGIIFVPLTGWFSEMFSLHHALGVLILFPVIGSLVALKLPK